MVSFLLPLQQKHLPCAPSDVHYYLMMSFDFSFVKHLCRVSFVQHSGRQCGHMKDACYFNPFPHNIDALGFFKIMSIS